jgi:hypothetical protein
MYSAKIKSIKKIGIAETYDLHTPKYHNFFLDNGILSHNSGKTWTALSICEMMSLVNGNPFTIDQVVFSLRDLLKLVNSGGLKEGSCIIYDEPQISIGARQFMSLSNKTFSFLGTTWRHRRFNLFFCTPWEDLLDLNARKLFQAKFTTKGIDRLTNEARLRPVMTEYNSSSKIFYEHFLRVVYKPDGRQKYVSAKLKEWRIPKPSQPLIDVYEKKKLAFTSALNKELERSLIAFERKQVEKELAEKKTPDDERPSVYKDADEPVSERKKLILPS